MEKQHLNNLDYKRRELEGTVGSFDIEGFDGVRKNNARKIFGILLIIIVVDFAMEIIM
jgi:hypothetical protein